MTSPRHSRFRKTLSAVMASALFYSPFSAAAAPAYPEKAITVVIPFSAGSETDFYARLLIRMISKHLGDAPILGENHAGESGTKAASEVKSAPADGYTLMTGRLTTQALAPAFNPALPYRWNDFTFLGMVDIEPLICAVKFDAPYKDARALLQAIRKSPGSITYAHTGTDTISNLTPLYFFKLGGLKPGAVTGYKAGNASADTVAAVVSGAQDFFCTPAGSLVEPIKAGKVRALFTTAPGRIPELPDVKSAREAGFADLGNLVAGTILVGPAGLPAPVVARWKKALAQLAKEPEWISSVTQHGGIQTLGTSKDNEQFIKSQYLLYERLVLSLAVRGQ